MIVCRLTITTTWTSRGHRMATDTVRWDSDTSAKLELLRAITGRTLSSMVGYAISAAATDCAEDPAPLTSYLTPLARRANAVRTSVTVSAATDRHLQTLSELLGRTGQPRSRYAIARACVRRWLDRDLDDLALTPLIHGPV